MYYNSQKKSKSHKSALQRSVACYYRQISKSVESQFMKDRKGITDTLRRGESRLYADSHKACATIYDEDYDYTVEDSLEVKVL